MKIPFLLLLLPAMLFAAANTPNPGLTYYYPSPAAPGMDVEADIIVYGGTSGGVVAAVQAARMGKSVALIVFGRHLGGLTSGGLTQTDGVDAAVQGGITREFFDLVGRNSGFKPSEAEAAFEALVADPVPGETWDAPVAVYYEQRIASVEKNGARITALRMENGGVFRGRMFIDASYEGDLMARAGVDYFVGREDFSVYGESKAGRKSPVPLPGVNAYVVEGDPASGLIYNVFVDTPGGSRSGDGHVQAYNFRMYTQQNANPALLQPLFPPAAYDASKFEILYRYHRNGGSTAMQVGNDINNHEMFNRGVSTDHIGGNRWPDGNGGWISWADADYATRELMFQDHVAWQLGMLWYLRTDARYRALATDPALSATIRNNIQALLDKVDQLGFPLGEYPETNGWSHELYVREARRMVADFVATQAHYDRVAVVDDPVALANYSADSHHVRRIPGPNGEVMVEGDTGGSSATPWRLSYRVMTPKAAQAENLFVTWAISASHVAFGSMRMEPCLMVLSQSAATAAALCIDRAESVHALPYALLKHHLIADGQILGDAAPTDTGIVVDNNDASGFAITGEWTPTTASSGFYGGNYLHDGDTRGGKTATFTPNLPAADTYEVFLRWTANANRASAVPVDIVHASGSTNLTVNQRSNGGTWFSLGQFAFAAGTTGRLILRNEGVNGYVIADAVRFVALTQPVPPGRGFQVLAPAAIAREEGSRPARFQILRDTESLDGAVTLRFDIGGSAVPGTHYETLPASLVFPANRRSVSLYVRPIADDTAQGPRTVTLGLLPDPAYAIGSHSTAEITIHDKPYDDWRHRTLLSPNGPDSGPGEDADEDGADNRMEFFMGTDPMEPGDVPRLELSLEGGEARVDYPRSGAAAPWQARVLSATNLVPPVVWTVLPLPTETLDWNPANGDRHIRRRMPLGDAPPFLRLDLP